MQTQKTKILYVITKSNWGGAQRYVFNLATSLPENFEAVVALGGNGELKTRLDAAGIKTITLPYLGRDVKAFADILTLIKLVSLFKKEKPDIVHLNSSKIGGLGALAGRLAGIRNIIFTAHGWAFREERPELQKQIIKFLSWLTILFSHHIITVSERDEREGKDMPFARKKVSLIHNGIETPDFLSKEAARKKILDRSELFPEQISPEALWIGTIGELHKNKGHAYAIDALANWNPPHGLFFFVIGEGEERRALEVKINSKGLGRKINLLGNIEDAPSLLKAFDIFLFPSIKEGLPYALVEAGFAGLPVVASGVGGIPEVIDDMETGMLVRPKCPEEMSRALQYMVSHPQNMKDFGKKLSANVKKHFSFAKMKKATLAVYESRLKN